MTIIEALLALLVIVVVVMAFAVTRQYWQFSFLRFWHFILRFWQTLLFSLLCLLIPMAFRRFVALSWDEYYERLPFRTVTLTWLIVGGLAACLVLGWSAWDFRHHKVRGMIGLVLCILTLWWVCACVQTFPEIKQRFDRQML